MEMQESLGRVYEVLPQYFRNHVDISCGTEGVAPTVWSDTELIRNNLSARETSIGILERKSFFPDDILNVAQRAKAEELLAMNDYASERFWPLPGKEVPRQAPWR